MGATTQSRRIVERVDATAVTLVIGAQSFQSLTYGGIALFLPIIRKDVGLSYTQAGALAAASTIVYALMQMPSGYLADRFGAKRVFLVGLSATNLLALSFSQLHAFSPLVLNQALAGFFRAFTFAPGLLLMMSAFPLRRRATAMGLFVAGGFSSSVVLNLVGPLIVVPLGWRLVFVLFGIAGLLTVVACWFLGPAEPTRPATAARLRDAVDLFRNGAMLLIAAIQYVRLAVVSSLNFWLPTIIVVQKGYPLAVAGLVIALSAALTAPSNFLGGYVSDRLGKPLLVIGGSLGVLALTTSLIAQVESLPLLVAVVAVNGFFVQLYFGPLFALPIELVGPRTAGLTSGFGNLFANLGGFTFAYLLGAVRDATGSFAPGLHLVAAMCIVGLFLVVVLARLRAKLAVGGAI